MKFTAEMLRDEYESIWARASIKPENATEVKAMARRIIAGRKRYEAVSTATGVPWFVVGLIHSMECGLSFEKHLHNGDPLHKATVRVPKGRGPFDTWEESAIDAMRFDGLDKIKTWDVAHVAFALEKMNGFGYRRHKVPSPYLWSFTSAYSAGKYVADGKWSSTAVSKQAGGMAILRVLGEMVPDLMGVNPKEVDGDEPIPPFPKAILPEPPAPSPVKEAARSWSVRGLGAVIVGKVSDFFLDVSGWVSGKIDAVVKIASDTNAEATSAIAPLASLGQALRLNLGNVAFWITVVILIVVAVRHTRDKTELAKVKVEDGP